MDVEIWSDVMCPWCYIGKRRFESAIAALPFRDEIAVIWRSYRLRPSRPVTQGISTPGVTLAEVMSRRFNMTPAAVRQRFAYIRSMGEEQGVEINLDHIKPVSSYDAHRLLHYAAAYNRRGQLLEGLFRAHFGRNENVADHAVLLRLVEEVGLDRVAAQSVLAGDEFGTNVLADEQLANDLGVSSVPTYIVAGTYALTGAHSPEDTRGALLQAWERSERGVRG